MRELFFLVLAAALLLPSPARAQLLFHATLARNDSLRYDLHTSISMAAAGKDPERLEQTTRIRLTIAEVDRDGNAAVRMAFETLSAKRHTAAGDTAYDPDTPTDGSALSKTYAELANSIIEFEVSTDGRIGPVTGLDAAIRAAHEAGIDNPERLLGPLAADALRHTLQPIFTLDQSATPRKPDDSWTESFKLDLVDPYAASIDTRYTLKSVSNDAAELAGPVTITLKPRSRPDASPTLAITDQSGAASAQWDTKASRLISFTRDLRISWKASLELKEPIATERTTISHLELNRAK